jgi:N-acetylmuramoyl-L-alanine amidase
MGWLKNWINRNKKTPAKSESPATSPSVPAPAGNLGIKKIAIIVGHGNGDSGALGWNGVEEFKYNSMVAEEVLKTVTNKEIKVFYRGPTGIAGVAAKAVAWGPDLTLELHLNAFNGKAFGCEVLVLSGDTASGKVAESFALEFTKKFNRTLRRDKGVNWITSSDRGGASLRAVSSAKYSILVEPFFIDTKSEWVDSMDYARNFLIPWIIAL